MNNVASFKGQVPIIGKQRPFGFDLVGCCMKCRNKNICVILRHIGSMQVPIYPEDFKINIERCKWENPESEVK